MAQGPTRIARAGRMLAAVAVLMVSPMGPSGGGSGGAVAAETAAPYDDTLARLAEILGALHHLRPLCGAADEAQTWRDQMAALIEAEQPSRERRRRLVDRFNRAWRGFATVHRACTPAARALAERYRIEGEALGRDLLRRWGRS